MLSTLDLILVIVILIIFLLVGVYFRMKQKSTSDDYFLAGRSMSALPAAFSISVSFVSSVSLTLYIGEIAFYGVPYYLMALSGIFAGPILIYFVVPYFYDSPYLSIYQFFEERYSRVVRLAISLVFICAGIINCATVGYAASISAEVLADFPFWASALIVGLLSTIYSTIGGIKAVIWTDVAQALFMILFFVLILAKAFMAFDSFEEAWSLMVAGKRTHLNFLEGPAYRYSFQSVLIFYIIWYVFALSVSQPGFQRWRSVPSLKTAKITVILSLVLFGFFAILVYITGLVLYAFYSRCETVWDPIHSDKLSLHFVSTELANLPGVTGLCMAGILSSALSTISSYINSFAAVTLEDFIKIKWTSLSTQKELLLGKMLTAFYGVLATCLMFVAAQSASAFLIHMTAYAIVVAPPLGLFFLGLWWKRANTVGVSLGFLVSVALVVWLSIGSYVNGTKHQPLGDVNPLCLNTNTTSPFKLPTNITHMSTEDSDFFDIFYNIPFTWYAVIGLITSVVFGWLFSLAHEFTSKLR